MTWSYLGAYFGFNSWLILDITSDVLKLLLAIIIILGHQEFAGVYSPSANLEEKGLKIFERWFAINAVMYDIYLAQI